MNTGNADSHVIVVSMGDPAGVGWPVLLRLLAEKKNTSAKNFMKN